VHRRLRRLRRDVALVALMLALGGAVAVHHGAPAMVGDHHGMDIGVVELCVAAFSAVGAAVVAIALGLVALGRWRPPTTSSPVALVLASSLPLPRSRAGPAFLCVFRS
jgi:hypothetical protein